MITSSTKKRKKITIIHINQCKLFSTPILKSDIHTSLILKNIGREILCENLSMWWWNIASFSFRNNWREPNTILYAHCQIIGLVIYSTIRMVRYIVNLNERVSTNIGNLIQCYFNLAEQELNLDKNSTKLKMLCYLALPYII